MKTLSIVIPARNEEKRILPTLENYYDYYSHVGMRLEMIIVCNDCQDNTYQVASDFALFHRNNVKVINFEEKIGKGGAIKEGFRLSKGDVVCFVDADSSTKPAECWKLIRTVA